MNDVEQNRKAAFVYTFYRIIICALLGGFFLFNANGAGLGEKSPEVFLYTLSIYALVLVVSLGITTPIKSTDPKTKTLSFLFDLLALGLLVHSSGGINSNLTALFFVTVATASILLTAQYALLVAALAAIGLMLEQFQFGLDGSGGGFNLPTEAGFLGIGLFGVTLAVHTLARQLERSRRITFKQNLDIERLQKLNQQVVEQLEIGIVVFDEHRKIKLSNHAAQRLSRKALTPGNTIPSVVFQPYKQWREDTSQHPDTVPAEGPRPELEVKFVPLNDITIAYVDDRTHIIQQAQNLKLASLGQLSATIAHEIRNPLAAISHAAQLLDEDIPNEHQPLMQIIHRHVARLDGIVSNVLAISRGVTVSPESIALAHFIQALQTQWQEEGLPIQRIRVIPQTNLAPVLFDIEHLNQVITNLVINALKYSQQDITITMGQQYNAPWLAIADNGPGIPKKHRENIFDPFFSLATDGTGMGLFVANQHCQINRAHLHYEDNQPGAKFVITFTHAQQK